MMGRSGQGFASSTMMQGGMNRGGQGFASSTVQGNGQPIVAGKVSAINGSIISITNNSNVTYSVDATNAKITQGNTTVTITSIVVGDTIVAQGTINGTSVIATSVMDQTNHNETNTAGNPEQKRGGFFGGIGQFFMRMFGF